MLETNIAECENALRALEFAIERKKIKKETLLKEAEEKRNLILELDIDNLDKAAIWLKELAQNQKKTASKELSTLATMALQYSLGSKYKMEIEMEGTAKNPKADVWIIKNNKDDEKEDPMEDNGGGIIDMVGSSMRITILDNYTDPIIDGPIIFDEPFKMVSQEYIPLLSEFVSNVSKDFGRQVIVVTHNDYLSSMTDSNVYVSLDEHDHSTIEIRRNSKEE